MSHVKCKNIYFNIPKTNIICEMKLLIHSQISTVHTIEVWKWISIFHHTIYWVCGYSYLMSLKPIHVSKIFSPNISNVSPGVMFSKYIAVFCWPLEQVSGLEKHLPRMSHIWLATQLTGNKRTLRCYKTHHRATIDGTKILVPNLPCQFTANHLRIGRREIIVLVILVTAIYLHRKTIWRFHI